jgi:hypothetical protein
MEKEMKTNYPWYQPLFWGGALFSMFLAALGVPFFSFRMFT